MPPSGSLLRRTGRSIATHKKSVEGPWHWKETAGRLLSVWTYLRTDVQRRVQVVVGRPALLLGRCPDGGSSPWWMQSVGTWTTWGGRTGTRHGSTRPVPVPAPRRGSSTTVFAAGVLWMLAGLRPRRPGWRQGCAAGRRPGRVRQLAPSGGRSPSRDLRTCDERLHSAREQHLLRGPRGQRLYQQLPANPAAIPMCTPGWFLCARPPVGLAKPGESSWCAAVRRRRTIARRRNDRPDADWVRSRTADSGSSSVGRGSCLGWAVRARGGVGLGPLRPRPGRSFCPEPVSVRACPCASGPGLPRSSRLDRIPASAWHRAPATP